VAQKIPSLKQYPVEYAYLPPPPFEYRYHFELEVPDESLACFGHCLRSGAKLFFFATPAPAEYDFKGLDVRLTWDFKRAQDGSVRIYYNLACRLDAHGEAVIAQYRRTLEARHLSLESRWEELRTLIREVTALAGGASNVLPLRRPSSWQAALQAAE
jgi:hypothetical protein